ncbi:serine/threonine-protein kinase [Paramecium bursaria Chlorella virus NE-JV-1]|nr:serine/threonine-protein kinase [Paramecium bursaria Chlorella virus NE-JV-1]
MLKKIFCFASDAKRENMEETPESKTVFAEYEFDSVIGNGAFSSVWKAKHKKTGDVVAIKSANGKFNSSVVAKEYSVHTVMNHPNILAPLKFYHDFKQNSTFLVFNKMDMDLFELAIERTNMNIHQVRNVLRQIAPAIAHMHDKNIVHRDIKPENIMFDGIGKFFLTDLGGCEHEDKMTINTLVGTSSYLAPEIAEEYLIPGSNTFAVGKPSDIYSLGATLFAIATRVAPGPPNSKRTSTTAKLILRHDIHKYIDQYITDENFADLLRSMTNRKPMMRLTIQEVMRHPFYIGGA